MLADRVAYTCSRCSHITYAASGHVAVTCSHCGIIDLGTEIARDRWRSVCEIRMANRPPVPHMEHVSLRVVVAWALVAAFGCALVALIALGWAL